MSYFSVDVEADGPIPGDYSMISLGVVRIDNILNRTFYAELKPISDSYMPEALKVTGFTREQTLNFEDPLKSMMDLENWLIENSIGKPVLISDNNTFDGMFVFWYFHHFLGRNPFGFSARRIGDFYCGLKKDLNVNRDWKRLRKTKHTHKSIDDAKGNAEAFLEMCRRFNIKL